MNMAGTMDSPLKKIPKIRKNPPSAPTAAPGRGIKDINIVKKTWAQIIVHKLTELSPKLL